MPWELKMPTLLGSLAVAAMLTPGFALAGTFTKPVRLPSRGEEERTWRFAVNDRGQAVAVTASADGDLIYPVRSSGRLGRPWLLRIPGGYRPYPESSVTLDDRGRIAVALSYIDRSYIAKEEYGVSCCLHAAIASWQLGASPPMAQVISPPGESRAPNFGELEVPQVVIGPKAVTALWTTGGVSDNVGEAFEGNLDEAFGPFGKPLRSAVLIRALRGIQAFHLALGPDGRPVASWLFDRTQLGAVNGSLSGAFTSPMRTPTVPRLWIEVGFSSDDEGVTTFTYWTSKKTLMMMASKAGAPFGGPRAIARTGHEGGGEARVVLGGRGALLATWGCLEPATRCENPAYARRGNLSGPLGGVFTLPGQRGNPAGFIDNQGHTVLVYETPKDIAAITAPASGAFSRAQPITPHLSQCVLDYSTTYAHGLREEPSYTASANGHAIVAVRCGGSSEYLIRYTP